MNQQIFAPRATSTRRCAGDKVGLHAMLGQIQATTDAALARPSAQYFTIYMTVIKIPMVKYPLSSSW